MHRSENNPNPRQEPSRPESVAVAAADSPEIMIPRRTAVKKFVMYTAPAVIALLTARDAAASP